MIKTTEELKRSMYHELNQITGEAKFDPFQNSLEAYLERLRIETNDLRSANEQGFAALMSLKGERDDLRNKLQAFEFANKSASEFLIEAQAKVRRQRQSIGQLKNDRDNARNLAGANYTKYQKARQELSELRKLVGSTIAQNRKENAAYTCPSSPYGHEMNADGMCRHCNETITRAMP